LQGGAGVKGAYAAVGRQWQAQGLARAAGDLAGGRPFGAASRARKGARLRVPCQPIEPGGGFNYSAVVARAGRPRPPPPLSSPSLLSVSVPFLAMFARFAVSSLPGRQSRHLRWAVCRRNAAADPSLLACRSIAPGRCRQTRAAAAPSSVRTLSTSVVRKGTSWPSLSGGQGERPGLLLALLLSPLRPGLNLRLSSLDRAGLTSAASPRPDARCRPRPGPLHQGAQGLQGS